MVNQFGEVITETGAQLITERREKKAALLAEMRAQRAEQALDRHSHVGVELAQSVPDPGLLFQIRKALAELSNLTMIEGHPRGAALLASLARGVERGQYQRFGDTSAGEGEDTLKSVTDQLTEAMTPQTTYPSGPDDISQPTAEATYPSGPDVVHAKPQPMPPLTADDMVSSEPLATFEDDDPDDMPGADEPATSPEPEETPARRAAAQRRAAKRAQHDN